jgi:DNA repair protein RadD
VATELRPYQACAIDAVRAEIRGGKRAVCLVVPTGGGKTRIGAEIARGHAARGGSVLWLAHRTELVGQAADRLRAEGLAVGLIAAGVQADGAAPIQVASIQTLIARAARPTATLLVLDEAHHYVADEWGDVAQHYASTFRIGLTATPERSDGKPLGDLFESLVAPVGVAELTEQGFLTPCEVLAPRRRLKRAMAGDPVERYIAVARGRRAIFFAASVEQAEELAERLLAAEIPAACIHGETPPSERASALDRFVRGELVALTNVFVLTEGTDLPPAEVCVLARGFSNASTYLQCVGRVLRPSPGKSGAIVLDLCGVSRTFGVPADEREYSLEGKAIRLRGRTVSEPDEPGLGSSTVPKVVDAEISLVREISATAAKWTRGARGERRAALEQLLRTARERGFKRGWAVHQYRERFGTLPWEST